MFMHSGGKKKLKTRKKTNQNLIIQEEIELKNLKTANWAQNPQSAPVPGFPPAVLRVGDVVKSLELGGRSLK